MRDIFSHYVGIIMLVLSFLIGIMFIYMNMEVSYVKSFHTAAVQRYSDSNLNAQVGKDLQERAARQGWTLNITDQTFYKDRRSAMVTLDYKIDLPILAGSIAGRLVGYAH